MVVISTIAETQHESTHEKLIKQAKTKQSLSNENLNRVWCLGHAGKMLIDVLKSEFGSISEFCIITGLNYSKIKGMAWGDVKMYSLADVQQACQSCYWQFLYSFDSQNFTVTIKTPNKTFHLKDFWNSDQSDFIKSKKKHFQNLKFKKYTVG